MSPLSCENHTILRDSECSFQRSRSPLLLAESTALLIVDVQEENWHGKAKKDFFDFPKTLKRTIAHCRSENSKIVWVMQQDNDRNPQRSIFRKHENIPFDESSSEELPKPQLGDTVVTKTGISGTTKTRLLSVLEQDNIDTVLVCGLYTSVCVQHTAFGIFERGFRTFLVEDACADQSKQRHSATISLYGNYMYEMLQSRDLEPKKHGLWKRSRFGEIKVPSKSLCCDDNASDTSSVTNATELFDSTSDESSDSVNNNSDSISKSTSATQLSAMAMVSTMMLVTVMATTANQRVALSSR